MQLPAPSQWPPVALHTVPFGANDMPQAPPLHVRVAQTESAPGQSVAALHWTH